MKRSVEVSGKTLEEVLERASRYFDVPRERLNYEIVSENKGFLGILVPKVVKVRVWVEEGGVEEEGEEREEKRPSLGATNLFRESPREVPTWQDVSDLHDVIYRFLHGLFERMGVDVRVTIDDDEEAVTCRIEGKDAGVLIGRKGETLEALELLLRTFLGKRGLIGKDLLLDIADYRKRREESLKKLAERIAQKVVKEKKRFKLEPMNARERRIIHTVLKDHPQVVTYSVGTEPSRRVVVELKNAKEGKGVPSEVHREERMKKPTQTTYRRPRRQGGKKKSIDQ